MKFRFLALFGLAACGGGTDIPADSDTDTPPLPPPTVACIDDPPWTPEAEVGVFDGVLEDSAGVQAGAAIDLIPAGSTLPVDSTISDEDGYYSLSVPMSDGPFVGFVSYRLDGYKPHASHRPSGIHEADDGGSLRLLDQDTYEGFLGAFGASDLSGLPAIALILLDCDELSPLRDAVVSVTPMTEDTRVVYTGQDGNILDVDSTRRGTTWIFGVEPGDVTVTVTYEGFEVLSYDLFVEPDSYHTISSSPVRGG